MINNWVKKKLFIKTLASFIVFLFISVSFQTVFAIENNPFLGNAQNEKNKSYVDPNIHLTRTNLPILKRSLNYFKNSDNYDAEIGKVMEQIINLIEFKDEINSKDVENILIINGIANLDIYTKCYFEGYAYSGIAYTIPLLLFEILFMVMLGFMNFIFIGIGGFLHWRVIADEYGYSNVNINIINKDTSKTYNVPHTGFAFGFFGVGYIGIYIPFGLDLYFVNCHASIVFVRT